MSTYGYIKHDELSGYAIAHHGIKGQKWGVRRFQNQDGSLTEEGRKRYGISDQSYSNGKSLYRGKGEYTVPLYTNIGGESRRKAKQKIEDAIRYDATRALNGEQFGHFNSKKYGKLIGYGQTNPIHHFADKNGNIALSYSRVPTFGDIYVKGNGNLSDINLRKEFKIVPAKLKKMQIESQKPQSSKDRYHKYGFFNEFQDKDSDFTKAEYHLQWAKDKGMLNDEAYDIAKKQYHLSNDDIKELREKYK